MENGKILQNGDIVYVGVRHSKKSSNLGRIFYEFKPGFYKRVGYNRILSKYDIRHDRRNGYLAKLKLPLKKGYNIDEESGAKVFITEKMMADIDIEKEERSMLSRI